MLNSLNLLDTIINKSIKNTNPITPNITHTCSFGESVKNGMKNTEIPTKILTTKPGILFLSTKHIIYLDI